VDRIDGRAEAKEKAALQLKRLLLQIFPAIFHVETSRKELK